MAESKGQDLWGRFRLYASIMRYGTAHNRDFAREHMAFFQSMQGHLQSYIANLDGLRVLDVGCGKSFWLTLLLHSSGARVTGIDDESVTQGRSLHKYVGIVRHNGLERALRTMVWDAIFAAPYYRELEAVSTFPLCFEGVDVRKMSVMDLGFAEDTFDLIVSHEVFEHLSDVPAALRSMRKVLKPEGIAYIYIHNYTSLSGGHHIAWKYPDSEPSETVPPWDHLRQNLYPGIPSWINRLRERDYRRMFEDQLEILDWLPTDREGGALLTPEVRAELADYDEEELLTKGFVIVARPRPTAG